jgi:glycosyltransferase involved in cell wall biosynthesis
VIAHAFLSGAVRRPGQTGWILVVSIIIPAHNEARVLGRLLGALTPSGRREYDILVVANGCSDDTVAVARTFPVNVLETPVASKAKALALGDKHARDFPRLYVDADVELSRDAVELLVAALRGTAHAAAPKRVLPTTGVSWPVRAYYEVWNRLPVVQQELVGRGVIAVDEIGHERLLPWGEAMADDLRASLSFEPEEMVIVEGARVFVWPPRTYRDLLARRVRAMTGNSLFVQGPAAPARRANTSVRHVVGIISREPRMLPAAAVFVATAVLAKVAGWGRARGGDTRWLRDESSRQ